MSKGAVELAASGKPCSRQAMWEVMRTMRRFTYADLFRWDRDTVRDYVQRLLAGGFLKADRSGGRFTRIVFELVRDVGMEAPKLQRDGSPSLMGRCRENLWRAMKMGGTFTYMDLAVTASTEAVQVSEMDARDYVKHLLHAGYLAIQKPATPTSKAVYRLAKNTGPLSPMVTRAKVVFDPNLGRIAWHEEIDA
jgi:hypothetical protein